MRRRFSVSTWSATVGSFVGVLAGGGSEGVDGAERTADAGEQVSAGGVPDGEHPADEVGEVGEVGGRSEWPDRTTRTCA